MPESAHHANPCHWRLFRPVVPTANFARQAGSCGDSGKPCGTGGNPCRYQHDLPGAKARLAAESGSTANGLCDTTQGTERLDVDAYFSSLSQGTSVSLDRLPPLLLPSANNVHALADHLSRKLPAFLAEHGIASAPSRITYDERGNIQLPADYPYANELKQALASDPVMGRELSTLNALASHLAGMNSAISSGQGKAATSAQGDSAADVAAYRALIRNTGHEPEIVLQIAASGGLTATADGVPL